ncbi:MAG: hypothetical protein WCA23_31940 [Stellaceae bacterium]
MTEGERSPTEVANLATGAAPQGVGVDDPERVYAAAEALAGIHRLFASDVPATRVITGLLDGMTADEIRRHYGLSAVEYDTARRRIRRTLLRHGLTWSWS